MNLLVKTADNWQVPETFPDRGRTDAKKHDAVLPVTC